MPFLRGKAPVRSTLEYLRAGRLVLRDKIRVLTVNYNAKGAHNTGAKEFVFWHLPQIQYMNPDVQVATLRNLTPSPFVRCYFDDGREMLVDVDGRDREQILEHLIRVVGRSEAEDARSYADQLRAQPSNFGPGCLRPCICEARGQVPCSGVVPIPTVLTGKYRLKRD